MGVNLFSRSWWQARFQVQYHASISWLENQLIFSHPLRWHQHWHHASKSWWEMIGESADMPSSSTAFQTSEHDCNFISQSTTREDRSDRTKRGDQTNKTSDTSKKLKGGGSSENESWESTVAMEKSDGVCAYTWGQARIKGKYPIKDLELWAKESSTTCTDNEGTKVFSLGSRASLLKKLVSGGKRRLTRTGWQRSSLVCWAVSHQQGL